MVRRLVYFGYTHRTDINGIHKMYQLRLRQPGGRPRMKFRDVMADNIQQSGEHRYKMNELE